MKNLQYNLLRRYGRLFLAALVACAFVWLGGSREIMPHSKAAAGFDVCVQDDAGNGILRFNSTTGDYQFQRCGDGGFTISGTGAVPDFSPYIQLKDVRSDRIVKAQVNTTTHSATGSVVYQGLAYTLNDSNTLDDTCACPRSITWAPESISQQVLIGTVVSVPVSFTSNADISNVQVQVDASLAPFVTTSPASFSSVSASSPQPLTLFITAPKGTSPQMVSGVISLQANSSTLATTLPVTLDLRMATATVIPQDIALPSSDRLAALPENNQMIYAKDQIDIFFKDGTSTSTIMSIVSQIGGVFLGSIPDLNFYEVQVPQEGLSNLSTIIDQLSLNPNVSLAIYHRLHLAGAIPNDPGSRGTVSGLHYAYPLIHLPEAWDITKGEKVVGPQHEFLKIGVIDTNFNISHPDLKNNIKMYYPFSRGSEYHGTGVASIVGASGNNGIGIAGTMWSASLYLYAAAWPNPLGFFSYLDDGPLAKSLNQAIIDQVRVVNMSYSDDCSTNICTRDELILLNSNSKMHQRFFDMAKTLGVDILWICIAGNKGIDALNSSPARLAVLPQNAPNVVVVSAVDEQEMPAVFKNGNSSNYGSPVTIAAPGKNVPALDYAGDFLTAFEGTSAAAPYVTGVVGLMLSVNPSLKASTLKTIIQSSGKPLGIFDAPNHELSLLNAYKAVQQARDFVSGPTLPPTFFYDTGLTFAVVNNLAVDSQSRLVLTTTKFGFSCPFNDCGLRLASVSPIGTENWGTPLLFGAVSNSASMYLGQNDRVYILSPSFGCSVAAYDANGTQATGWPIDLRDPNSTEPNWNATSRLVVDKSTGIVYGAAHVFFSFSGFPSTVVALNPDGTVKWRQNFPGGGPSLAQGLGGDIYDVGGIRRFDHLTGNILCQQAAPPFNNAIGSPDGVFTTNGTTVSVIGGSCSSTPIFTSSQGNVIVVSYDQGKVFAIDQFDNVDQTQRRLFGISKTGSFLWRNTDIAAPTLHVIKNGVLYVSGQHVSDSNKPKVFLVNPSSGQIVNAIDPSPACATCGLAAADDGTLYLIRYPADTLSDTPKIYRLK